MTAPALPHRWRLWLIIGLAVINVAALITTHIGVADGLVDGLREPLELALYATLALLFPASADAILVEIRRRDPSVPAIPDEVRDPRTRRRPPGPGGAITGLLVLLAVMTAPVLSGCSAGPQLPVTTVPMSISCSWTINTGQGEQQEAATVDSAHGTGAQASAVIADSDCLVDRSSAEAAAATTGNDNRGARVDAELPVHVSATGE